MTEPTIICPKCQSEIKLTESLAAPLVASMRVEVEKKLARQQTEMTQREAALAERARTLDEQVSEKLKAERDRIAADEQKKARVLLGDDLAQKAKQLTELQEVLKDRDGKLAEAQKAQAEFLAQKMKLDDKERELDLTLQKRLAEQVTAVRASAKKDADEEAKLKLLERDQIIGSMQTKIDELGRKLAQGSQQLQGEVQELDLEAALCAAFPLDTIDPVPKGEHGGDALQRVTGPAGKVAGTIIWESKRTKTWSDGWLTKLKGDQRAAKAEVSVVVSQALPKGVEHFELMEGVWVVHPRCALAVAATLRHSLLEISAVRQAGEGQQGKMELVYRYLTSPHFRQRLEAMKDGLEEMHADLQREKKFMLKQWAKREQQVYGIVEATSGMHGDLQGIVGKALPEIEGLDLKLLEDEASD